MLHPCCAAALPRQGPELPALQPRQQGRQRHRGAEAAAASQRMAPAGRWRGWLCQQRRLLRQRGPLTPWLLCLQLCCMLRTQLLLLPAAETAPASGTRSSVLLLWSAPAPAELLPWRLRPSQRAQAAAWVSVIPQLGLQAAEELLPMPPLQAGALALALQGSPPVRALQLTAQQPDLRLCVCCQAQTASRRRRCRAASG